MVLRIPNTLAMLTVDWENPFYIANSLLAVVRGYIQGKFGRCAPMHSAGGRVMMVRSVRGY